MQKFIVSALLAMAGVTAFANINHAQLINLPGAGTGVIPGGDLSSLEPGESIFGYGAQANLLNYVADDFTVPSPGYVVTGLCFFMYQTGAAATSITQVDWDIVSNITDPLGLTNSPVTASWWAPNGVGVYRVSGTTSNADRRIQLLDITFTTPIVLAPGTYYLRWGALGQLASGPWQPPLPNTLSVYGKNAKQKLGAADWVDVTNGTTGGADLPFIVKGELVPEPGTLIALGLGAAALLRRRRKA